MQSGYSVRLPFKRPVIVVVQRAASRAWNPKIMNWQPCMHALENEFSLAVGYHRQPTHESSNCMYSPSRPSFLLTLARQLYLFQQQVSHLLTCLPSLVLAQCLIISKTTVGQQGLTKPAGVAPAGAAHKHSNKLSSAGAILLSATSSHLPGPVA